QPAGLHPALPARAATSQPGLGRSGELSAHLQPLPVPERLRPPEDGLRRGDGLDLVPHHRRPHRAGAGHVQALGSLRIEVSMVGLDTPVTPARARAVRSYRRGPRRGSSLVYHLVLVAICAAFALPFVIMLTTALKTPDQIFSTPPRLLPTAPTLENFDIAVESMPLGRYLVNTVFLVVANVTGTLLSCPLVAYSLTKIP